MQDVIGMSVKSINVVLSEAVRAEEAGGKDSHQGGRKADNNRAIHPLRRVPTPRPSGQSHLRRATSA